jgi:hypothetical protein
VIRRLRFGEKLAALSALALFGFLFLDWFGLAGTRGVAGWDSLGWLALALCVLAIAAGLVLPFVVAFYESPVLPVLTAIVTVLLGGLAAIAVIAEGIFQPGDSATTIVLSGYWLGLIAAAGIARGGFLSMREEYLPGVAVKEVEVRPAPPAVPAA